MLTADQHIKRVLGPDTGCVLLAAGAEEPSRTDPDLPRQHDAVRVHLPCARAVQPGP